MESLFRLLFYAGADPKEFKKCEDEIRKSNQKRLMFYLTLTSIYLAFMTGMACVVERYMRNFLVYSIPLLICIALLITTASFPQATGKPLTAFIFIFTATLYGMGIYLGTISSPDSQAVTFPVLLVLAPLLFTMRPIRNIANIALFVFIYVLAVLAFKTPRVVSSDLLHGILFGTVSCIVSTYLMGMMVENAIVRSKLRVVAESDLNTGLKNRNAYEKHMLDYPMRCSTTLCCVYVDVNGLHDLNNTKGHAEGDKMLQIVAQKMQEEFGFEDCYRVGGDEFVAFVLNEPYEETKKRMAHFVMQVEIEGYSVAIGAATHSAGGIDMAELVRTAEQRMYMAKQEHYDKISGHHR